MSFIEFLPDKVFLEVLEACEASHTTFFVEGLLVALKVGLHNLSNLDGRVITTLVEVNVFPKSFFFVEDLFGLILESPSHQLVSESINLLRVQSMSSFWSKTIVGLSDA